MICEMGSVDVSHYDLLSFCFDSTLSAHERISPEGDLSVSLVEIDLSRSISVTGPMESFYFAMMLPMYTPFRDVFRTDQRSYLQMKPHAQDPPEMTHRVLREGATEPGGSGAYLYHQEAGRYLCAGCGTELFDSEAKYDSGTGWPSFSAGYPEGHRRVEDHLYGMRRFEVVCAGCAGHLGHVFSDDDSATGERFCINSAALRFVP